MARLMDCDFCLRAIEEDEETIRIDYYGVVHTACFERMKEYD